MKQKTETHGEKEMAALSLMDRSNKRRRLRTVPQEHINPQGLKREKAQKKRYVVKSTSSNFVSTSMTSELLQI